MKKYLCYFLKYVKIVLSNCQWMFLNVIVNHIPCWQLRRVLYRCQGMKIGKRCRIGWGTMVNKPSAISLGDGVIINEWCTINGGGGISIGDEVSISTKAVLMSVDHDLDSDDFSWRGRKIYIGNYCFIGAGATILGGSYLEDSCAVGAGCVVSGRLEADMIYVGNPPVAKRKRIFSKNYKLKHEAFFR